MGDLFLLSEGQMARISPFFPLSHGVPRVDDRRVVSGIIYVIRNGLQWKDAPAGYGPHKTLYNRFIRWSRLGVFNRIFAELAAKAFIDRVMEAADIPGLRHSITALLAVRTGLMDQIREMDRVLREFASRSQSCRQLMSIPGVGVQTSAAFAAAIDEAGRFRQSRTAGAYFGLVPRRHQSGEIDWTGRITKQGDSMVRKLLYEAANSILTRSRGSFALKRWAMKIAKRRGLRKARVALARRLAVIMHAILRDGTLFEA